MRVSAPSLELTISLTDTGHGILKEDGTGILLLDRCFDFLFQTSIPRHGPEFFLTGDHFGGSIEDLIQLLRATSPADDQEEVLIAGATKVLEGTRPLTSTKLSDTLGYTNCSSHECSLHFDRQEPRRRQCDLSSLVLKRFSLTDQVYLVWNGGDQEVLVTVPWSSIGDFMSNMVWRRVLHLFMQSRVGRTDGLHTIGRWSLQTMRITSAV